MVEKIKIISETSYESKQISEYSETSLPVLSISIRNGKSFNLEGAVIEGLVEYQNNFLVFLTNDIPSEEQLNIYYISSNFEILDQAVLGGMYATGNFGGLRVSEPNEVRFTFIGATEWKIQIYENSVPHIPLFGDSKGVSRPLKLSCYFKITGVPKPEKL